VLQRSTGVVVKTENLDSGNILLHPKKPWLYMSFFRRRDEVVIYDLASRTVRSSKPSDPRIDRMAFWDQRNELLVASPMESRVLLYDADSLELRGTVPGVFGIRVLAIDHTRQWLLGGSLATGTVVVIDLNTGKRLASHYLGPWLRTIVVDAGRGVAYVSSNGALYVLRYSQ
jgi:hypothetical protein